MRPKEIKEVIRTALEEDPDNRKIPPLFIWGAPGVGKTQIVEQVAKEAKVGFKTTSLTTCDASDLRGIIIPSFQEGVAKWLPPSFLPQEGRDPERGICFYDDLPTAPPLVQAAAYELVLKRRSGSDYIFPKGWIQIAAGNRSGDRAATYRMPTPLENRFEHIEFVPDINDWVEWALENGIHPSVIAFLYRLKSELLAPGLNTSREEHAFPSPRTWEYCSNILYAWPRDTLEAGIIGAVGRGAGSEFYQFLKLEEELPDINKILEGENIIPERADLRYALISTLAIRAPLEKFERLIDYSFKLPEEFSVLLLQFMRIRDKATLRKCKNWPKWAEKYVDLFR